MTATANKWVVPAPCTRCPFRKDVPIYLHRERRTEIAMALLGDQIFHCHEQVDYNEEDEDGDTIPDPSNAAMCAGAAKAMLLADTSMNWMRIASRVGDWSPDLALIRGADVWDIHEWPVLPEGATGDDPGEEEEIETCGTVNEGCLAPAGYLMGNGVVHGSVAADGNCKMCGEPCCSNCLSETGMCGLCAEYEDD